MKKILLMFIAALMVVSAYAVDATWTAANQGYANASDVESVTLADGVTAVFAKGSNKNNAPKYYAAGTSVRMYSGNTLTITSTEALTKISFTFDTSKAPAFDASTGEVNIDGASGSWTGNATELVLTVPNTSGQQTRIQQIVIGEGGEEVVTPSGDNTLVTPPATAKSETWYLSAFEEEGDVEEELTIAIDGNDMYIKGFGSDYLPDAWVKGTINGKKVTFKTNQYMGNFEYSEVYTCYFAGYDYDSERMGDVVFDYDADNSLLTTDAYILINTSTTEVSPILYYAMVEISKTAPQPLVAIEAPANLTTNEYLLKATEVIVEEDEETGEEETYTEETSFGVQIGFDGKDVYFQGLVTGLDGWAKGTLSEDGKTITIPANQYIGSEENYFYGISDYFFTAADEDGNLMDVVFNYDAEKNTLSTQQTLFVNGSKKILYYYNQYENVTLTKMVEVAATPANPAVSQFDYNGELNMGYIGFNIPTTDVDGNDLMTSKLFYQIMIMDMNNMVSPLKLTADLYEDLTEDMETIPYNYSDYDISNSVIYLNQPIDEVKAWKQIGIRSIYTAAGETRMSEISWYDLDAWRESLGIVLAKAKVVNTSYVDMAGRRVNAMHKGLLIQQTRMADGTVKNIKVIRK